MMRLLPFLLGLISPAAHAQIISDAADGVSNGLFDGPGSFEGIILLLRGQVWPILTFVALFIVVRAGLKLINSQDEGKLETAKRTIAAALVGLMLAPLADPIFYAVFNPSRAGLGNSNILANEIGGIIDWVLVLIAPIAVLMIVVSAIRGVSSFGKEDAAAEVRQAVYGVVVGIGLIIFAGAIKLTFGLNGSLDVTTNPPGPVNVMAIITRGVDVAQTVLMFLALIAVAVIVYAGFMMVLNFGNDEQYNKAKGIVWRVALGLVIIIAANLLISFVVEVVL